jgi:hypothetical protein
MKIVEGVTRKGRTLRVVYGEDVRTVIAIDGKRAEILLAHTYRGRVGRTWLTSLGFVRVPYAMGDELPPAILDGEPVAATVEEAERWCEVLLERMQRFVAAMRRVARAEAGYHDSGPAVDLGDSSRGVFQIIGPSPAKLIYDPSANARAALGRIWRY